MVEKIYWWHFPNMDTRRTKPDNFIKYLNQCHPTIKFSAYISETSVDFLDTTTIRLEDCTLITDIHSKSTDLHNYLHFKSCHPPHMTKNLPYSQFLQLKCICNREEDFIRHSEQMIKHFTRRSYPLHILTNAYHKIKLLDTDTLLDTLKVTNTQTETVFCAITNYHPLGNPLKKVITSSWKLLSRSCSTWPLHDGKVIYGYWRKKNLKDLLVSSTLRSNYNKEHRSDNINKWTNARCRYCPKLDKSGNITSTSMGTKLVCIKHFTCKSLNLICCITCKKCFLQYLGQTKRCLMHQLQGHFYTVSKGTEQLGRHFNLPDH